MRNLALYCIIILLICMSCASNNKQNDEKPYTDTMHIDFTYIDTIQLIRNADLIPDSILHNPKKLYRLFIDSLKSLPCLQPLKTNFPSHLVEHYRYEMMENVSLSTEKRELRKIRDIFGYTFDKTIDVNEKYGFIKKIFNEKIANKHDCELYYNKGIVYLKDGEYHYYNYEEYVSDCMSAPYPRILYSIDDKYARFSIGYVYFSKLFTTFHVAVQIDGSMVQTLLCTYDHDGNFIDGIETGSYLIRGDFGVYQTPPGIFYSYFDKNTYYHIIRIENTYLRDKDNYAMKTPEYKEIFKHFKYQLTDEGKFVLISRKQKDTKKSMLN